MPTAIDALKEGDRLLDEAEAALVSGELKLAEAVELQDHVEAARALRPRVHAAAVEQARRLAVTEGLEHAVEAQVLLRERPRRRTLSAAQKARAIRLLGVAAYRRLPW